MRSPEYPYRYSRIYRTRSSRSYLPWIALALIAGTILGWALLAHTIFNGDSPPYPGPVVTPSTIPYPPSVAAAVQSP